MSDTKCGGLILDTIDQLRKRKARPDLDRICHMLERKHGLKSPAVNEELTRLVNEGTVVKVDYKGNTSYRNAAKWAKTKTQFYGSFYNSSDISSVVLEAVRALTLQSKDQPPKKASIQDIEQYLLKRDSQSNLNLATLRAILEKEVEKRNLHQLPSGEYVPVKVLPDFTSMGRNSSEFKKYDGSPNKRLKSDSDAGCHENSSNSSEESQPSRCEFCSMTAYPNKKGEPEDLLVCRDCGTKAHPSCLEYTKLLYEEFPQPQNWQCPDCKTCHVCDETGTAENLLTCFICFKGYHLNCHDPIVPSKPTGTWLCCTCDTSVDKEKQKIKPKVISIEDLEAMSALQPYKEGFHKSLEQYPALIPVAKKWSIENVETFFRFIGFEDEALAFREQEIDGLSLLLMKRNDVLTGLGIKLGPALKIYKHVLMLQSRIGDN
ncbi:histone acetyltransferase KAT6B [Parasteatoda tepidariorum]|uniref:histone acetyltransferase KAT6B n=1 Tax=Parasteatoda tepidariorum TaxID=114398 RepID=UPI00077F8BF6|nr:histone acetyltransferase KAT6B [Parasteatoda tepidariorum]